MPVLTGIDILGIQSYIYASNRLRDVLAATWMVEHVTCREMLAQWGLSRERVLLAAGGNAIIRFDSEEQAKRWTALYTRCLLDTAPGLEAVVAHRKYKNNHLAWALKALQIDLARAKLERRLSVPQLGLGVTASCTITGLPANDVDQGELVSMRVKKLRDKKEEAKARWNEYLPERLENASGWKPKYPDELDQMGRTSGDTSLVGVVHIDGNRVGAVIKQWLEHCNDEELGDEHVQEQYQAWSNAIGALGKAVLRRVMSRVATCIREEDGRCVLRGTPHDLGFSLRDESDGKQRNPRKKFVLLPVQPILLGGDDLTFVCDGRIALDLAVNALQEFDEHPIPHLGGPGEEKRLTACAGVALVKAHTPFHSSYRLADGLCQFAKAAFRDAKAKSNADDVCWIDWHIGSIRPGDSVADIRERQYRRNGNELTMRPYPLGAIAGRTQAWKWLDEDLLGPGGRNSDQSIARGFRGVEHWAGSRNRVKLLDSLVSEEGSAEESSTIQRQLDAWKVIEEELTLPGNLGSDTGRPGFIGSRTPLRDAIELMDLHIRLDPSEENR